jgi:hypothetical protein
MLKEQTILHYAESVVLKYFIIVDFQFYIIFPSQILWFNSEKFHRQIAVIQFIGPTI